MNLDTILSSLGWQDGFQIPVANAENRELEAQVARLTLHKIQSKSALDQSISKLEGLQSHMKFIQQETGHNQNLINAHNQQIEQEDNKLKLNGIEGARIAKDGDEIAKETAAALTRYNAYRTELEQNFVRLERLKSETNWDAEALLAWEQSLEKREADNALLRKFTREDERKYNELEARRQQLQLEHVKRRETVAKMVADITNYERIVERTGKMLKQQGDEKDALINQWKNLVKILHQRDKEIDNLQNRVVESHEILNGQRETLNEQNHFLTNEIRNNDDLKREIESLNAINSNLRMKFSELSQYILLLNGEFNASKRSLASTANQLVKERGHSKDLSRQIDEKEMKIDKYESKLGELENKLDALNRSSMTAAERAKHLEKLLDFEEKHHKQLINDINTMQLVLFRSQQALQDEINIGKGTEFEINGCVTNCHQLRREIREKQNLMQKQNEMIYELNYRIDELQRKVMNEEQLIPDERGTQLKEEIKKMECHVREHMDIKKLLQIQLTNVQDDTHRLSSLITTDGVQIAALKDKLQNETLCFEGGKKQLIAARSSYQEKQVEQNMVLLRLNQFDKTTRKTEKNISNLQKFRLSLEQAMSQRLLEINATKDILLAKRRNLDEDRGRLKSDLANRRIKMEQIQKKYYVILMSFGKDDDGQPLSITHFKIKNAQEKFLLQQEGDELDCKIKKAEKEIVAMENTLQVVNTTNANFKRSLGAVEESGVEMEEMAALENELRELNGKMRHNKRELLVKQQELAEIEEKVKEIAVEEIESKATLNELENEYNQMEKNRLVKEEKIRRAESQLKKLKKQFVKTHMVDKYERNMEIKQLRDANKAVVERLVELSIRYQETAPLIDKYALEHDIKLPEKKIKTPSTNNSSESYLSISTSSRSLKSTNSSTVSISKVELSFDLKLNK